MQQLPAVSIVIANHNHAQWIGDAMRSIADQDYPQKRIVVVDDGSTDNSWDVIRLVAGLNAPSVDLKKNVAHIGKLESTQVIAYHFDKAGGPSRTRNLGIKLAWQATHIFGFLDADDTYLPGKISRSVAKLLEDPERIGVVYTDYECENVQTGVILREYKEPFSRHRLLNECIISCPSLVSRTILEKAGLFDENLRTVEDYDLWLRCTELCVAAHIPECLVKLRVGAHSSTATVSKKDWEKNWQYVAAKTQQRMMKANGEAR